MRVHSHRGQRTSGVLVYQSPPHSLQTGSLYEPGTQLVARKPQQSALRLQDHADMLGFLKCE